MPWIIGRRNNKQSAPSRSYLAIVVLCFVAVEVASFQGLVQRNIHTYNKKKRLASSSTKVLTTLSRSLSPTASSRRIKSAIVLDLLPQDVASSLGLLESSQQPTVALWLMTALGSGILFAVLLVSAASPVVRDAELLEKKTLAVDELPELDVWIKSSEPGEDKEEDKILSTRASTNLNEQTQEDSSPLVADGPGPVPTEPASTINIASPSKGTEESVAIPASLETDVQPKRDAPEIQSDAKSVTSLPVPGERPPTEQSTSGPTSDPYRAPVAKNQNNLHLIATLQDGAPGSPSTDPLQTTAITDSSSSQSASVMVTPPQQEQSPGIAPPAMEDVGNVSPEKEAVPNANTHSDDDNALSASTATTQQDLDEEATPAQERKNQPSTKSTTTTTTGPSQDLLAAAIAASRTRVEFDDETRRRITSKSKARSSSNKTTDKVQKYIQKLAKEQTRELLDRKHPYQQVSEARESPPNRQGSNLLFSNKKQTTHSLSSSSDRNGKEATIALARHEAKSLTSPQGDDTSVINDNDLPAPRGAPSSSSTTTTSTTKHLPKLAKRKKKDRVRNRNSSKHVNAFIRPKDDDDKVDSGSIINGQDDSIQSQRPRRRVRFIKRIMCSALVLALVGRRLLGALMSPSTGML